MLRFLMRLAEWYFYGCAALLLLGVLPYYSYIYWSRRNWTFYQLFPELYDDGWNHLRKLLSGIRPKDEE